MPPAQNAQTNADPLLIGVDAGNAFTDLVAFDGASFRARKSLNALSEAESIIEGWRQLPPPLAREDRGGGSQAKGRPNARREVRVLRTSGSQTSADAADAVMLAPSSAEAGVIGAAYVSAAAGVDNVIACDVGDAKTNVALGFGNAIFSMGLLDIRTIQTGGASTASIDADGALHVGPASATPACYGQGATEATLTDANLCLGRILPRHFPGGAMVLDAAKAHDAIGALATRLKKTSIEVALDIVRIAEANVAAAIAEHAGQLGRDLREFTLASYGGAGGLHAPAVAEILGMARVFVPPMSGVLGALGLIVAPPIAHARQSTLELGVALDDERLPAEFGRLSGRTVDALPHAATAALEAYADVQFLGQTAELRCRVLRPTLDHIRQQFLDGYRKRHLAPDADQEIEIVALHIFRIGNAVRPELPRMEVTAELAAGCEVVDVTGELHQSVGLSRSDLLTRGPQAGPFLLIDPEATTYVPPGWRATGQEDGCILLERR